MGRLYKRVVRRRGRGWSVVEGPDAPGRGGKGRRQGQEDILHSRKGSKEVKRRKEKLGLPFKTRYASASAMLIDLLFRYAYVVIYIQRDRRCVGKMLQMLGLSWIRKEFWLSRVRGTISVV
jgi:hypothetical protein